ncbi:MAG: arylsulfatase [Agriterribacter sp.]
MIINKQNTQLGLLLLAALVCTNAFAQQKKPNIVYILADDLGYGDIGVMGQTKIETPNIDKLAASGLLFKNYYAFPVCAPSRYLFLTGKHSGNAYIRGNDEWAARGDVWDLKAMEANPFLEGQLPIPDSTITISKVLKKSGYTTGVIGKWGLGAPYTAGAPNNQGFDYFFGYNCQRMSHTYYPAHLWENEYRIPLRNKVQPAHVKFPEGEDSLNPANYKVYTQPDYAPDLMIDAALRFIDNNKSKPFFLCYTTTLPHVALQAPQKWIDYYHKKFGEETPYAGGNYAPSRYPHATYAAMISTLDEQVGKIVAQLKKLNLYDNTIIVFTSDNGPASNGGADPDWFNSAGPYKGSKGFGKGFVNEGGIRVPFIIQWPAKIKAATTTTHIAANWDFFPTITDIIGIAPPKNIDGLSYNAVLSGKENAQKKHEFLYWEFPESGGQQAVRLGDWKGIRKNIRKGNLKLALYDLSTDPGETNDIALQHPGIVKEIEKIMKAEHTTPRVATFLMPALEN